MAILTYFGISKLKRTTAEWIVLKKQQALTTILANGRVAGSKVTPSDDTDSYRNCTWNRGSDIPHR
jgi:hypothetical protein